MWRPTIAILAISVGGFSVSSSIFLTPSTQHTKKWRLSSRPSRRFAGAGSDRRELILGRASELAQEGARLLNLPVVKVPGRSAPLGAHVH